MNGESGQLTSERVRQSLIDALRLDLVGPGNEHPFAKELLPEPPTRWYLTGFLTPTDAPISQRFDETSSEEIDSAAEPGGLDDDNDPDKQAASAPSRRSLLPSSMGLSVLVSGSTASLRAKVSWGDYNWENPEGDPEPDADSQEDGEKAEKSSADTDLVGGSRRKGYRRIPRTETIDVTVPHPGDKPQQVRVPNSNGLMLVITARDAHRAGLPVGTKALSFFLVNYRQSNEKHPYRAFAFQCTIELACAEGFVARPDLRQWHEQDEWDQRVADLQYRDVCEFSVGHGVSTQSKLEDGTCKTVRTVWIPLAKVERVMPETIPDVELGMEEIGASSSFEDIQSKLLPLAKHYREWIKVQRLSLEHLSEERQKTAEDMFMEAELAANRIEAGINTLENTDVFSAFKIANRAVARAFRQRVAQGTDHKDPNLVDAPKWYPFQLAYLLMTLRGVVEPSHNDRRIVDLLFFPTGGGKTEAYLGLAAFTLVLRRLKNRGTDGKPSIQYAGVSVLMRYTLRLLTLDQLARASGLICALELERQKNEDLLGKWPFEIGLWVGSAATPNVMGHRGDKSLQAPYSAYTKTMQFQRNDKKPSPIPLENCPWCGTKFNRNSFRLIPNIDRPKDLRVHCTNHTCAFHGDRHLPIVAVDEPIYRRLPCFIIATVDKFAALPWIGHTGALFGKVDRFDLEGFYGPCDPGVGTPLPAGHLPTPDLIIQDELHLISGPLGTIAGLYETVIDALSSIECDSKIIGPKIIASTATVRRADSQIRALFGRNLVKVFPPPGPDRRDSFFAKTISSEISPARQYIGIAAQGRSLKVVLLRTALALLSAGQKAWKQAKAISLHPNPADGYMTLLGYFNSLRELGGSRRITEDEVRTRLTEYNRRKRREPEDDLFVSREIDFDVLELTSRVNTSAVASAKHRLSLDFENKDHVDVALATNMISVGLDILRLGLMVVLGQPKTSSEYIQATSRVGRDSRKPGLVVTLLNIHRPRDRSYYERFTAFHESFYRHVEATSVTPFSPRALDRALPAALVALCRLEISKLTPPAGAKEILTLRNALDDLIPILAERAKMHKNDFTDEEMNAISAHVYHLCGDLLDDWLKIAKRAADQGSAIQYQREINAPPRRLLYEFLHSDLPNLHPINLRFRANRSMRDVESSVEITVKNLNDWGDKYE